jgi:hypothetical protein
MLYLKGKDLEGEGIELRVVVAVERRLSSRADEGEHPFGDSIECGARLLCACHGRAFRDRARSS